MFDIFILVLFVLNISQLFLIHVCVLNQPNLLFLLPDKALVHYNTQNQTYQLSIENSLHQRHRCQRIRFVFQNFLLDIQNEYRINRALNLDEWNINFYKAQAIDDILEKLWSLEKARAEYFERKKQEEQEELEKLEAVNAPKVVEAKQAVTVQKTKYNAKKTKYKAATSTASLDSLIRVYTKGR